MSVLRPFALFVAILTLAACGTQTKPPPDIIQAGQVDIQLPPGWKVTKQGASEPGSASNADAVDAPSETASTIPLAKQNPTTEFFQASGEFSSCLKALGVTFIGAPDASDPSSPTNDPDYLKSLETCASQSHILQALKDFQTSQNDLTPKQIQQENEAYLRWRTCMIGRGWTVAEPTPDSKGRLFSISTSGGGPQMTPPPGENPTTSQDIQDCATETQNAPSTGQS